MVRSASNRLIRRHDNEITKLKWGLSCWLDRQGTGIRNAGVELSCLILNMELIIKADATYFTLINSLYILLAFGLGQYEINWKDKPF